MNPTLPLTLLYLLLAFMCPSQGAPLPIAGETSLTSSIRSFESALTDLDSKISLASKKRKVLGLRENWMLAGGAAMTTLATGGFIIGGAVPMAVNKERERKIRELEAVVERENAARAAANGGGAAGVGGRGLRKRAGVEGLEKAVEELVGKGEEDEVESFQSALSRSSSRRMSDFEELNKEHDRNSIGLHFNPAQMTHPQPIPKFIHTNAPLFPSSYNDKYYHRSVSGPLSEPGHHDESAHDDRLSRVESALLDLKQHQHDQQKLSLSTKVLLAIGAINAVGGAVSAELVTQNAIEAAKRRDEKLPDVTNLDQETCKKYAGEISGLDCTKAMGKPVGESR